MAGTGYAATMSSPWSTSEHSPVKSRSTIDQQARRLTLIAALVGLVPATGLGALGFFNGHGPLFGEETPGYAVLGLVYMSPYLMALAAWRTCAAAARGGVLLPLGLLSLAATVSIFPGSGVTIVLFPATLALLLASVWSLRAADRPVAVLVHLLAGVAAAAVVVLAFFALLILDPDEPRSYWSDDVHTYTSDIITKSEAGKALGLLVVGWAISGGSSLAGRPAPPRRGGARPGNSW